MTVPRTLGEQIADLYTRMAEMERRARNRRRTGTIAETDEQGRYRVRLSSANGKPYLTGWIKPRPLAAGGVKIDVIHSVGEQVDVVSENGDGTDARIEMSDYSTANERENASTPLHIKIGSTVIAASGDSVTITADSKVTVNAPVVSLGGEGGRPVARVGDMVDVGGGSSAGLWPIVEGSSVVSAVD